LSVYEQVLQANNVSIGLGAFSDLEQNVKEQVKRIKDSPFLPDSIEVHGFIYDVKTGKLNEVAS
jgi:carbonic anhydrase